jgi:hypothetical protein
MTYVRVRPACNEGMPNGADESHLAELVRGDFSEQLKAPSSAPSGHLLPKGRRTWARG